MKEYLENFKNNLSLKDRVYKNIKSQIILGNIKPGTKLLEKELAEAMEISRGPIREALSKLEKDGFVILTPRKGVTVTNITSQEIKDILEERDLLEQFAVAKTFSNLDQTKLIELENELKEKLSEINKIVDNNKIIQQTHFSLDSKFHSFFTNGCGNKKIIETLDNLRDHIHRLESFYYTRSLFEKSTQGHLEVIAFVKQKDFNLFNEKLIQHSNSLKNYLLSQINE